MSRPIKVEPTGIKDAAADWIVRCDAGLKAAEKREFVRWQSADPRHAAALANHDGTWAALERPHHAGQSGFFLQQLGLRASRRRRRRLAGTMALLAVLLGGTVFWRGRALGPAVAIAAVGEAYKAVVVLPEKRTLPDGSVIELNLGAEIEVDFSKSSRRVTLRQGEAHFQVAKDKTRPFVVTAKGVEVRAVGTAFSVEVGSAEVQVLVTEGRVEVEQPTMVTSVGPASPTESQPRALLDAGNRLVVDIVPQVTGLAAVSAVSAAELEERLAWRAPRLEFSETPLPEAVALLNRHSTGRQPVRFVVADPTLVDVQVSGFFRADNTDTFVRLLEASFGVKADRQGDKSNLRKAQ